MVDLLFSSAPDYVHMHDQCKSGAPPVGLGLATTYTDASMPRQKKPRQCRGVEGFNLFKPSGIPLSEIDVVELGLDELEAMRLCDLEDKQQEEAAVVMGVSRGTVQRLLQSGRKKLLYAISEGQALAFADADHVCIRPRRGGGRHGRGRRGAPS
jgi:predicted DNA-binding protein (UPF0251 family)